MGNYLSRILYIVTGRKHELLVMIGIFLSVSLLDTVGIGLIGPFMALATSPKIIHQNAWLNYIYNYLNFQSTNQFIACTGLLIVAIFYAKSFLNFRMQAYVFKFSYEQAGFLTERLLKAYLAADYTFHLSRSSSTLLQTILTETAQFSNNVLIPLLISTSNAAVLIFLLLLLTWTSPIGTAAILGAILLAYVISSHFKDSMSVWLKIASEAQTSIIRVVNHSIGGIKEVRVIGCEPYFEEQISTHAKTYAETMSSVLVFGNLPRILVEAFLITFLIGFVSVFLMFGQEPQRLIAVLSMFAIASIRMLPAASALVGATTTLRSFRYVVDKLYYDLREIREEENNKPVSLRSLGRAMSSSQSHRRQYSKGSMDFLETVVLNGVRYTYPQATKPSLHNVSLTIGKGEAIALIGKSGAGKTTLVDVILGLLTPQSGTIEVDGVSIYENLRQWQNLIGYIPQTIFLMDDTIERNIAFGVPDHEIDADRLNRAIQSAQLANLIQELPEGIHTIVGEKGVRLSGGQRQRIGIARALYHEREILILDEATAALDNETERLVNESIKNLSGQKTLIIIAHRLTTVEHCDRIYLMGQGQVLQSGSYQEIVLGESPAIN
jgi:ABC-type multidrug transport system fused ATPase/permease subunit